ncbi:MAG: hypothetical protein SFT93_04495 [Rickettsiaceae bacterium]|nr:hypothetical protein [Rickettsiaceae bacterium]
MKLTKFLLFLLNISFTFLASAITNIAIEVKEYDNTDAVILHIKPKQNIDVSYRAGTIWVKSKSQISFSKIKPILVDSFLSRIKNVDKNTITIKTKALYQSHQIIQGEKFKAIKFRTEKILNSAKQKTIESVNPKTKSGSTPLPNNKQGEQASTINIESAKDQIEIKFHFDKKVASAAFVRFNKFWLAFDSKISNEIKASGIIKTPYVFNGTDYTVFEFAVPPEYHPEISMVDNDWILKFTKNPLFQKKLYSLDNLTEHYGARIEGGNFTKIITVQDRDVGDNISFVTDSGQDKILSDTYDYNDFKIYQSLNGLAISWVTEKSNIKLSDHIAEIYSIDNSYFSVPAAKLQKKTQDYSNTSLPFVSKYQNGNNFVEKRANLYKEITISDDKHLSSSFLQLSYFLFKEGLMHDAFGAYKNFQAKATNETVAVEQKFYEAVLYNQINRYKDSEEIFKELLKQDVKEPLKSEILLWNSYNNYYLGQVSEQLNIAKYLNGFMTHYPNDIYWKMVFIEFEIAANNNDQTLAESLFKNVRQTKDSLKNDKLNYFKATFFKKSKKYNQALNYYDAVKLNYKDPSIYVSSQFDKIDLSTKLKQIDLNEAVNKLQGLTFLWRGDDLEHDILLRIAQLQQDTKDYIKSLRTYQYILDAFPSDPGNVYISKQMASIYNDYVFSENGIYKSMNDFEVVTLYSEFRELTPIGEQGDKITLLIAKSLIRLDLLDQAERILDHQVRYRLSGKDKIISGDHLATIYILNQKPQLAIDVINETDLVNYGYLEHLSRIRLKALAYIKLGDYNKALSLLSDDDSKDAKTLKEDAYFRMADWENFIAISEGSILPEISSGKILPADLEQEILRLCISYAMLEKYDELNLVMQKINTNNLVLKDALNLLVSSGGKVDVQNLDSKFKVDEVTKYFKSIVSKLFDLK